MSDTAIFNIKRNISSNLENFNIFFKKNDWSGSPSLIWYLITKVIILLQSGYIMYNENPTPFPMIRLHFWWLTLSPDSRYSSILFKLNNENEFFFVESITSLMEHKKSQESRSLSTFFLIPFQCAAQSFLSHFCIDRHIRYKWYKSLKN